MALSVGTAYLDIEPKLGMSWQRDIDRQTDGAAGKMESRFGSAFKRIGLALGGVFAAKLGVDFGRQLLDLGSQTEVFRQKARTVFEGQNADVSRWAKANASAFGLTDDKLSGLAANFGDLLKPMGFTSTQAADMATKVVGLSGALSAWSGGQKTAAEVSETLSKAMLGERDELKSLGISISQADVDARLAAKGQKELTGAALQQASAIATQELIFEKSTDAQKAWTDGSFDAIKKQNALKEKIGELKEDLAEKLRPAFAGVVGFLVDRFIPGIERAGAVIGPIVRTIAGGFRALFAAFKAGDGDVTSAGFAGTMERIGNAARSVVEWFKANWPQIRDTIAGVIDWIVTNVVPVVREMVDHWVRQFSILVDWVRKNWPAIAEAIGHVVNVVVGIFERLEPIIRPIFENIKRVVESAIRAVLAIIQTVLAIINGDWGKAWEGLKAAVSAAWEGVKGIVSAAIGVVKGIVGGLASTIVELAKGMWEPIKAGFKAVINWVIRAWNALEFKIPGFDPPGPGPEFKGFTLGVPDIKELAAGGGLRPGELAFTGEKGVELIRGGMSGNQVFPHDQLMSALGGLSSGPGFVVEHLEVKGSPDPAESARSTVRELRNLAYLTSGR